MEVSDDPPPRGFQVGTSEAGDLQIRYRTTGMFGYSVALVLLVGVGAIICLRYTVDALTNPSGIDWQTLLIVSPFWMIDVATSFGVAWYLRSITTFTFLLGELTIERSLFWYRRQRVFPRNEIGAVKQVEDLVDTQNSCSSWSLTLIAKNEVRVLSQQPIDKSDWLGPIIAEWAGVVFEQAKVRKCETM